MDERSQRKERKSQISTLLWVNKDAQSKTFSKSDDTETSRILSHVRSRRHNSGRSDKPWKAYTSCLEMTPGSGSGATTTSQAVTVPSRQQLTAKKKHTGSQDGQAMRHAHFEHPGASRPMLSIRQPFYNSSDPFHSTILGMDATKSIHVISNPVSSRISRITFLAEALAPACLVNQNTFHRHDKVRNERLRACVSSELLMCSSIAHGASSLAWVDGTIGDEQQSQHFLTKTLTAVRKNLAHPDRSLNRHLVLSIYTLACTELWNAIPDLWSQNPHIVRPIHLQACRTHLGALILLIQNAGGWKTIDSYILEGILLLDKTVALYNMDKPIASLSWDPSPIPPEPRMLRDFPADMTIYPGYGFENCDISSELRTILQNLATFMYHATNAWDLIPPMEPSSESWLYLRYHTFYYRILLYEHQTELEYSIKLVALISQLNLVAYAGGRVFTDILIGRLRVALKRCWTDYAEQELDLRLWCLTTALLSKGSSPQKSWFVNDLVELLNESSSWVIWSEFSQRLQPYLYVPERQDRDLSTLLNMLQDRGLMKGG